MEQFQQIIKSYLDKRAASDALFAESYSNKDKSIDQCCAYIMSEASKRREGSNCVAISDSEVFGMAVHYYDEKDIEFEEVSGYVAVAPPTTQAKEAQPVDKPEAKKKISPIQRKKAIAEIDQRQMSLF